MVVTTTRSGPGTFHVYAVDDADGSAGICSFFVKLNGTVSGVLNRSPFANYDTDPVYGNGTQSYIGFDSARTTTPILGGSQGPTNIPQIGGFGITAGNFQAVTNAGSYQAAPTSGQWGNYVGGNSGITIFQSGHTRYPLFLGEGLYTGAAPTVDITTPFDQNGTGFNVWNASGFPNSGSTTVAAGTFFQTLSNNPPCLDCEHHGIGHDFNNVNANDPGSLMATLTAPLGYPPTGVWNGLSFVSGPAPATPPTFDPATQKFSWNTIGSPIGTYKWSVQASNIWGTGTGFVTVNITSIPEPATLTLIVLCIFSSLGSIRCRRV